MVGLAVPLLHSLPKHLPVLHHQLWKLYWRHKIKSRGGRPKIDAKLVSAIRRLSLENPSWGAPRIHAEMLKLGWIVAIDMAYVRTMTFRCLYAFVVMDIRSRVLLHIEVSDHPTALWLSHEIQRALPPERRPAHLIRDNDKSYGPAFHRERADMGVVDRPIRPYSPWQNGHVERLIGSIRRECLDHIIILNARQLRRILLEYKDYYNHDRTHLSLGKDAPVH
jgi:putative transposase